MILWAALLYLSFDFSFALPTPSDIPINTPPSIFTPRAEIFGTRSISNIIWSCFSTIFACTWIAVHPNIPGPNDSQWAILRRRLGIMAYFFIVPELVIIWAARQHFGAKHFAKKYESRGWTMTHGFFVIMGGFTIHDEQGTPLRILEPMELERLIEAGRIQWPSITEAEIQDRSKGDHLSKGIVLVQASWFIFQCIVRRAYKLEMTELEVTTLAFAGLTGVIYYLWWNKPLDVRCSIPVYLLKDDEKEKVDSQNTSPVFPVADPVDVSTAISYDLKFNRVNSQSSPINEETEISQQTFAVISGLEPFSQEPIQLSHNNSTPPSDFQSTGIQRFSAFIRQMHGTIRGLISTFTECPFLLFLDKLGTFNNLALPSCLDNSTPLQVPTFYSSKFYHYNSNNFDVPIAMCVAVIFGGIHCVAWSFHFPTSQEKLAWRISAASMTGSLILFFIIGVTILKKNWPNVVKALLVFVVITFIMSYIVARIVLFTLPCIAFRALDPSALSDIQWAAFFPHIG